MNIKAKYNRVSDELRLIELNKLMGETNIIYDPILIFERTKVEFRLKTGRGYKDCMDSNEIDNLLNCYFC